MVWFRGVASVYHVPVGEGVMLLDPNESVE